MSLFGRRDKKTIDRSEARNQSLSMRPVRNPFVRTEAAGGEGEGGGAVLVIPVEKARRGRLVAWILRRLSRRPLPDGKRLELDEVGAFVWGLCDGTRTAREMIHDLAQRYHLNRRDAEASLVQFLRTLGQRNLVGFEADAPPRPPPGSS